MNLKKAQELEQLKSETDSLWEKVKQKRHQLKTKTLDMACRDFRNFFKSEGFTITEREVKDTFSRANFVKEIVAVYGSMKMVLSVPEYETAFLGAYSFLQLDIHGNFDKQCTIAINRIGAKGGVTVSHVPKTEEGKLDKEIQEAKERKEGLANELKNFDKAELGFRISKVEQNSRVIEDKELPTKQEFFSLKDLLAAVFIQS